MKTADVKLWGWYYAKVSGVRREVQVIAILAAPSGPGPSRWFRLRDKAGKTLPKPRYASALHETK